MDGLRARGDMAVATCANTHANVSSHDNNASSHAKLDAKWHRHPPRTAFCFAGDVRTFATPLMLSNHLHMLVRPLVGDTLSTRARVFIYFKLGNAHLAPLAAALRRGWLNTSLAEVVLINGSGSYSGVGWRPDVDGGEGSGGDSGVGGSDGGVGKEGDGGATGNIDTIISRALRPSDPTRSSELRPNATRCMLPHDEAVEAASLDAAHSMGSVHMGSGHVSSSKPKPHPATEVALSQRWCADAIRRDEEHSRQPFDVVAFARPDQVFLKPLPPYCTWEHTELTLACQQGGTDGVWVAPRAHAAQVWHLYTLQPTYSMPFTPPP